MSAVAHVIPTGRSDLKVAAILGVAAGLSVLGLMPYLFQLMPDLADRIPVPLPLFAMVQATQAALLCTGLAWLGLRMGHRVGLGAPLVQAWVTGTRNAHSRSSRPLQACLIGISAAALIIALAQIIDPWLPAYRVPPAMTDSPAAVRNGFLASFYGGIAEEVQLRLFLVTLLVWMVSRWRHKIPSNRVYVTAILVAAVLFGIGHLPAAANVWPLDAIVVVRVIVLNAVGAVAFGWLFWRRGLEMAMLAHFSADLVLHVALPLSGIARL